MKQRAFEILFEDQDLLVLNKKAGVLSIPDRYQNDAENLFSLLTYYREEIYPLHRLDKDTSGVMIYAKTEKAHKILSKDFEERLIDKTYLAVVEGGPNLDEGNIETFIAPSPYQKDRMWVAPEGKLAITNYKVTERFNNYSVLDVKIKTGRQHQIRVHLAHIGCPLATDSKYGNSSKIFASDIKTKKFVHKTEKTPIPLINRHSLHALSLGFKHPESSEKLIFNAPIPKDMRALINQLRKWD